MKPITSLLAALSLSAFGCAAHVASHPATTDVAKIETTRARADRDGAAEATPAPAPQSVSVDPRRVGDFVVFAFDGSFHDAPLTLTERVVERDDASITIDMTLAEKGRKTETLRVKTDATAAHHGDVLSVEKGTPAGTFVAGKTSDYESLIAKTVATADANEAVLDSVDDVVTVKTTKIPVTKTRYRVKIGKSAATMSTLASENFSWGDLGGEIKTDAGALVYRASLVDMGEGPGGVASLDAPITAN